MAPVVSNDDDGVDGVELDVGDLVLLLGHHWLAADGLVFVDAQVKDVGLGGEGGAGTKRGHVTWLAGRASGG